MLINQIVKTEEDFETKLYPKRGIALKKGQGSYVFDTTGKKYLDFMTNIGVSILGYSNPQVDKSLIEQLGKIVSTHQTFYSKERAIFLKALISILPKSLDKVVFTNSGAESVEAALKFASLITGRTGFIAAKNSYHGKTLASLSVTGQEKYHKYPIPELKDIKFVDFNNIKSLEQNISKDVAAVILEPIQGEGGIFPASKDYLKQVKKICQKNGTLLILDEIQTALRTGSWFAFESYGVTPDVLCLSKSWSYGLPFGAVILTDKLSQNISKGIHTSTFAGNPLVCSASSAVIKEIKNKKLLLNSQKMGDYFIGELTNLKSQVIKEVRGKGLMIAIELSKNATLVVKAFQEKGLLAIPTGENTIRFLPPINVSKKEIDQSLKVIKEVLSV